jgi:hypothetical protein
MFDGLTVRAKMAQQAGAENYNGNAKSHIRSEAAKANIKVALRLHQIAGRPTKQQLVLVFGQKGHLLTWPKRTGRFGITSETFQPALAKGVPAVPLNSAAKSAAEKTNESM